MYDKMTIEQIRENQGKSKLAVAQSANIPYTSYLRYENNPGKAPFAEVAKICRALNVNFEQVSI